jgi:hypothetical protein
MKCKDAREQLAEYLLNRPEDAPQELRFHLGTCPGCRTEFDNLRSMWQKLGLLPEEETTPLMRARFYAMLEGYREGMDRTGSASPLAWWRGLFGTSPVVQCALAALLLFLGVLAGRFTAMPGEDRGELNELRTEVQSMRQIVTLSLLQQQSASERLAGVGWSQQMQHPDARVLEALIGTLNYDPNVNVRLKAIDALYGFSDRPIVRKGIVDALQRDTSPLVQIALIDLVVQIRETQSRETLRRLADDQGVNDSVRKRAEWALQQLS